tara:strand:+ start:1946 stop:2272 length:327 start_codon:yes stop_codon:yes gene_type:complete
MNIELARPVQLVTTVTLPTHPQYYEDVAHSITYRDDETTMTLNMSQGIGVTVATNPTSDTHTVEFTLPNIGTTGSGSIEVYAGGDLENNIQINIIPITGETSPILINL